MEPEPIGALAIPTAVPAAVTGAAVTPPFTEDAALARRIGAGDDAAFESFYTDNVGRVYALSLRMAGDQEGARSLTQETFVRAWERIGSYRGESRLSSWLHRIAVNVALERVRRRSRWSRWLLPEEDGAGTGNARADDPEIRVDLERAIAALPPGARQMLVLRDIEGYSYEEIARLTGTALGTVKAQIHRARRLMREKLEP